MKALEVRVGRAAAAQLASEGWQPNLIDGLIGASGGPKWLILGQLDRALSRWLHPGRQRPLQAVGSSIGSWRHALLAQNDPVAAIDRFEDVYLRQTYSSAKPSVAEVTAASKTMLMTALGEEGAAAVAGHPWLQNYIVTAKGRGLTNRSGGSGLALGLGAAGLGNALSRSTLPLSFQRVVFAHAKAQPLPDLLSGFNTCYVPLLEHSVSSALLASGAIPYLFDGVVDVPGGPKGAYWDGGIIDYHFTPHHLIMLCPSEAFLASLPQGKIPDRRDFGRMTEVERMRYWQHCVSQSQRLGDEFSDLIMGSNPLADCVVI